MKIDQTSNNLIKASLDLDNETDELMGVPKSEPDMDWNI